MAKLLSYSTNFIDVAVSIQGMTDWRLTGYYGYPERRRRRDSWDLLRILAQRSSLPWCYIGDFNDILSQSEKRGRLLHPTYLINGFRDVVNDSGLIDLGMKGHCFTWEKSRGTVQFVEERLDRAMATSLWMELFNSAEVINLEVVSSDHSALLMRPASVVFQRRKRFRFENSWTLEPECKEVVKHGWSKNENGDIQQRIADCRISLQGWGDKVKLRFKKAITHCREKLKSLKRLRGEQVDTQIAETKFKLDTLLAQEEIFWKQRAKIFWLQAGDANTRLFHNYASSRRRKNNIVYLKDDRGNPCYWGNGLQELIMQYFQDLYTSCGCIDQHIISQVSRSIDDIQNQSLIRPFEAQEVWAALRSMHPDKSPGPDGMNPGFYQKFWEITGSHVTTACLEFLNNCWLPEDINDTSIVLIPKKKKPETLADLRPISLCNVQYKIVSKVLANRFKGVLQTIIFPAQRAFTPGRFITDNVIIAFEIGHYLKRKRRGKKGEAALKIDMSKAYDRVEWLFIKNMMLRMGFHNRWVDLIMLCISSVRYTVVHNGHEVGPIIPQRGLRQGDPLSPYLFLICAEGLSALLQSEVRRGTIHGVKVARTAPSISHLFFADDSFLFFRAVEEECSHIKECLQKYELASGQLVNYAKSSVSFSSNVSSEKKNTICEILEVRYTTNHGNYLGLPSLIGRKKSDVFAFIKEKAWQRMNGWKHKFLSRAGKEILLKSVVQAIPSYVMSVFALPLLLCEELERMMNSFWWGKAGDNRGCLRWQSWDKLSRHKIDGGLGFKKIHEFNMALLAKQSWKLVSEPQSLTSQVIKARYYPQRNFFDAKLGANPSYVWRSIMATQGLIKSGARLRIGSGLQTQIWNDPWLPDSENPYVESEGPPELKLATVNSLRIEEGGSWDLDLLKELFSERDQHLILSLPLSAQARDDCWIWGDDRKGFYNVKSGYKILMKNRVQSPVNVEVKWKLVWKLKIPAKVRNFLWRSLANCLPTKLALQSRRVEIPEWCPLCHNESEDSLHALVACPFARSVWSLTPIGSYIGPVANLLEWWNNMVRTKELSDIEIAAVVMWSIWHNRNEAVWNGRCRPATLIFSSAMDMKTQWSAAQQKAYQSSITPRQQPLLHWCKPMDPYLKCNVDAAVFFAPPRMGYGCLLRNSSGSVIEAIHGSFPGIQNPTVAEALGIREALSWLKDLNILNVIIESDAKLVIDALNFPALDSSSLGLLVEDCKFLAKGFQSCLFVFVKRSANQAAHALARAVGSMSGLEGRMIPSPSFISDVILCDEVE